MSSNDFINSWLTTKQARLEDTVTELRGISTQRLLNILIGAEQGAAGFNSFAELVSNETAVISALKGIGLTKSGDTWNFPHKKKASKKKASKKRGAKA